MCNAGVVTSPVINGREHRFREVGVYNGQMIFSDDETGTLWNHLTGQALHGPLLGTTLPVSTLGFTTVGARAAGDAGAPGVRLGETSPDAAGHAVRDPLVTPKGDSH